MSDPSDNDEQAADEEALADLDADEAAEQVKGGSRIHGSDPCEGGEVA